MAGVEIEDAEKRLAAATFLQNRILLPFKGEAEEALHYLGRTSDELPPGAKNILIKRWKQIRDMIQRALLNQGVQGV